MKHGSNNELWAPAVTNAYNFRITDDRLRLCGGQRVKVLLGNT